MANKRIVRVEEKREEPKRNCWEEMVFMETCRSVKTNGHTLVINIIY